MNRRIAFPFLTLGGSAVEAEPWLIALDDADPAEAGEFLPHWDRSTVITLRRRLQVRFGVASADLGIPDEELDLAVITRVGTGPGRLPRLITRTDRREVSRDSGEVQIDLQAEGARLSTVLDLFTEVVLCKVPAAPDPLSPVQLGDRLWYDRHRTRLEGEEPRFPLEVVDLRAMLGDVTAAEAPWYLDWSPGDWTHDSFGAIRLFLNSNREDVLKRVEDRDLLVLQAIQADVMSQVCERLLTESHPEEIISQREPGSLGAVAGSWLKLAWPGRSAAFARSLLLTRPSEFRASFLAIAELEES